MDTQPTQLDPDVVNLTKAFRQVESGNNFTARSKDGSFGAYQFIKPTWDATAKKFGVNASWEQATPEQQNEVAYKQFKAWKDAGYNVGQIASMHNAGAGNPEAYKTGLSGTNSSGVHYDVSEYAKKIANAYHTIKGTAPAPTTTPTDATTTPEEQNVPGEGNTFAGNLIRGLVRPFVRAVNTPIQGAEKLLGIDDSNQTDQYLGDVSGYGMKKGQTAGQRLKDIAGGALEVGSAFIPGAFEAKEGIEALSVGAKIAKGAKVGAITGGAAGAGNVLTTNPDATVGNVLSGAAQGAVAGGVLGGAIPAVTEGVSAGVNKIKSAFTSKSSEEIAAMARNPEITTAEVNGLSASEQEQFFKEKANAVKEEADTFRTQRTQQAAEDVAQANQEIKDFNIKAGTIASSKADSLKVPSQQLMRDMSATYRQLTDEAIAQSGGEGMTKAIPVENIVSKIDSKFEYNPEIAASLKSDLGLTEDSITNKEIYDKAKEIMQSVSKSSRNGNSVYSAADYEAMKKYSFLMDTLSDNGVDMSAANKFWREWVPTRDNIVTKIKPWDEGGVKGSPFAKTILRSEAVNPTAQQVTSKLDAQKLVSEIEERMNLPKGSIGKEVKAALEGVDQAKLSKETISNLVKEAKAQIAAEKKTALEQIGREKYDARSVAEKRAIIKKAIKYGLIAVGLAEGKHVVDHLL